MISEKEFASGFPGFWSECLPFLTPQLVAEFNVKRTVVFDNSRVALKPLDSAGDNSQNDFVAETAFELFATAVKKGKEVLVLAEDQKLLGDIASNSTARLLGLRVYWTSIKRKFPKNPTEEAIALATRIETFFARDIESGQIIIQPPFKGCGILNSCFGDVLASRSLCELKTVDRNLRSTDIRQVLIYCALNYKSRQYDIGTVTILNPRRAVRFTFKVEALVARVSRRTSTEVFHQITDFLSDFELMHQMS